MKRIYLLSLWLLACLVLPMKGQAVAQADLLNSERFEHIDSSADSGRGDGKYKLPNLIYEKAYGIAYDDEP